MVFQQIMAIVLERSLNATMAMDPGSVQLLAKLEGRVIAMDIESLDGRFYILPQTDRVSIMVDHDQSPDIIIEGSLLFFGFLYFFTILGYLALFYCVFYLFLCVIFDDV